MICFSYLIFMAECVLVDKILGCFLGGGGGLEDRPQRLLGKTCDFRLFNVASKQFGFVCFSFPLKKEEYIYIYIIYI